MPEYPAFNAASLRQPWKSVNLDDLEAPTMQGNRTFNATPGYLRTWTDVRTTPEALKHLDRLPGPNETIHMIMGGTYGLWQLVPATVERLGPGAKLADFHCATLSFSKQNAADMLAMIDAGTIENATLIISHYFQHTSPEIFDSLVPKLREKGHRVIAMRSHCKILLMKTHDGRKFIVESSANLRSSKNIEQAQFIQHDGLYDFHAEWMQGLFATQGNKST